MGNFRMKNLHRYISSLKMVFLVGFLLSAELLYGNPLQNAPQEKELVTHGASMERDIAKRSQMGRTLIGCQERWGGGTGECEEVVQCYERCYPGCTRSLMAQDECDWPWKDEWPETVEWKCVKNCGKEKKIKCEHYSYITVNIGISDRLASEYDFDCMDACGKRAEMENSKTSSNRKLSRINDG